MDPSKLPSMSRTPRPADAPPDPAAQPSAAVVKWPADAQAAFLSIAIGLILMFVLVGPRNLLTLATDPAALTAQDVDGSPLPYTHSAFIWTDIGVTAFALLLIVEGAALAVPRGRGVVMAVFVAAVAVGAFNLVVLLLTWGKIGFPLVNALAAAFAGYTAMQEWGRLKAMGRHPAV